MARCRRMWRFARWSARAERTPVTDMPAAEKRGWRQRGWRSVSGATACS
jgi:hypothetical protein